jgi:hypothetical protein
VHKTLVGWNVVDSDNAGVRIVRLMQKKSRGPGLDSAGRPNQIAMSKGKHKHNFATTRCYK